MSTSRSSRSRGSWAIRNPAPSIMPSIGGPGLRPGKCEIAQYRPLRRKEPLGISELQGVLGRQDASAKGPWTSVACADRIKNLAEIIKNRKSSRPHFGMLNQASSERDMWRWLVLLLIVGAFGIGARYSYIAEFVTDPFRHRGTIAADPAAKCGYYTNSSGNEVSRP